MDMHHFCHVIERSIFASSEWGTNGLSQIQKGGLEIRRGVMGLDGGPRFQREQNNELVPHA